MPIEHRVDPVTGIMHERRLGSIETQDEEEAFEMRSKDPLVVSGIAVLMDCREVEPPDSTQVVEYLENVLPV